MSIPPANLHFVFFPYTGPGHLLPIVDIARIISQRGAMVTIVTTPAIVSSFKPAINRAIEAKLKIQLLELPLSLAEFGLPEGCEDSNLTTQERHKLFAAMELLEKPAEALLRELSTPPDCIISDFYFSWTTEVARKFNIPRLLFCSNACFYLLCKDIAINKNIFAQAESDTDRIILPGLPDRVEMTKLKMIGRPSTSSSNITTGSSEEVKGFDFGRFIFGCMQAERASHGVVVNSFEELEPEYAKRFPKESGTNVYCVGPVSLYNKDGQDIAERGSKLAAVDDDYYLQWLNQREVESVLYVSFGTVAPVSTKQLIELGRGLESTNKPFIWCVKNKSKKLDEWFSEFEERVRDRGLIVHGWAPQVLILSHLSIGGFLTHCGWNSSLETICAGVPVVTWPFQWDQFYNEIYMVQILKIGVSVGVEEAIISEDIEDMEPLVKEEGVKTAVNRLLDEDGIGKECRERVRKLAKMAKSAMAEKGGSSYLNVSKLFQDVSDFRLKTGSVASRSSKEFD